MWHLFTLEVAHIGSVQSLFKEPLSSRLLCGRTATSDCLNENHIWAKRVQLLQYGTMVSAFRPNAIFKWSEISAYSQRTLGEICFLRSVGYEKKSKHHLLLTGQSCYQSMSNCCLRPIEKVMNVNQTTKTARNLDDQLTYYACGLKEKRGSASQGKGRVKGLRWG